MIPTTAVIPQGVLLPSPTVGEVLGPLAGCVLLAAVVALALVTGATIRARRGRAPVRRIEPAHAGAPAVARRPAA